MDLTADLAELKRLKDVRDEAKAKFDDADREFKQKQASLWEAMDEVGVDSLKMGDTQFIRSATAYATVQDREAFVQWAEENDDSLVENKERAALLNALVRERLDNEEALPPGVGMYVREVIAQRAA